MTNKPSAFLIMPFGEEFDPVYTEFIKPLLEEVGFSVERADDIESQQNILRDIVEKIATSDLIVADLTSANPNVFYELGLAHAFKKPVILMTQSLEEVPFDLKSYPLLEYNTHFAHIGTAKEKLNSKARGFLEERIRFGSPVTDFYSGRVEPIQDTDRGGSNTVGKEDQGSTDNTVNDLHGRGNSPIQGVETDGANTTSADDRGLLDHQIALTDGYTRIAEIIKGVTGEMQYLTTDMEKTTDEFRQISANPNPSSPSALRRGSRQLAERIAKFNSLLKEANAEYTSIAEDTEDSLEFVLSFQLGQSQVSNARIEEQIASLRTLESGATKARNSYLELAEKMDGLPRLERRLNREVTRASDEVRVMAGNLDRTIASISRALKRYT